MAESKAAAAEPTTMIPVPPALLRFASVSTFPSTAEQDASVWRRICVPIPPELAAPERKEERKDLTRDLLERLRGRQRDARRLDALEQRFV